LPKEPVIERGIPFPPIDLLARLLALLDQLILWNSKFKNRSVSDETLEHLRRFLIENELTDVKVRVNRLALADQYRRLFTNGKIFFLFRIFPGFFVTTLSLIFERITAGDYYNPFTDTIHIFSDLPPVVVHEGGHAKDFDRQESGGFYALMRAVPGMDLIQEDYATTTALEYFQTHQDEQNEIDGYKILYPAYGSYIGAYLNSVLPFGIGSLGAILGGHYFGRKKARIRKEQYAQAKAKLWRQDQAISKPSNVLPQSTNR